MDTYSKTASAIAVKMPEIDDCPQTVGENWLAEPIPTHCYTGAMQFATHGLGHGNGRCLVIGSPVFETQALAAQGWNVTFMDIRPSPIKGSVVADVQAMPFADGQFDAVSCTCVLCHAGLGRYGDPLAKDGDRNGLAEIWRVLRRGGKAAVMFGPCFPNLDRTRTWGTTHRIYSIREASDMAHAVGFAIRKIGLWCEGEWLTEQTIRPEHLIEFEVRVVPYCYLTFLLEK